MENQDHGLNQDVAAAVTHSPPRQLDLLSQSCRTDRKRKNAQLCSQSTQEGQSRNNRNFLQCSPLEAGQSERMRCAGHPGWLYFISAVRDDISIGESNTKQITLVILLLNDRTGTMTSNE